MTWQLAQGLKGRRPALFRSFDPSDAVCADPPPGIALPGRARPVAAGWGRRCLSPLCIAALLVALPAEAKPPLRENPILRRAVVAGAVGFKIHLHCAQISGRWGRTIARARQLERYVKSLGYTQRDINALIYSDANLEELKRLRDAYLASKGVRPGDRAG